MLHDNLNTNEKGHLTIGGIDTTDLAAQYGTPLYVLDEDRIRARCRTYVEEIKKCFGEGSAPFFFF